MDWFFFNVWMNFQFTWAVHLASTGRYSSVGIAIRYSLDGPWIEPRWGARFSAPLQTGPGAYSSPYTMGAGSFPEVKRPGRGVDHPPQSSAEVKEIVEFVSTPPLGFRALF